LKGKKMSPQEAFGVALIVVACAAPVIVVGVIYYLKKRFEHKQIMTAIEKGTPLSDLKPPKQNGSLWIKNITIGVALIIIGFGAWWTGPGHGSMSAFIALVLFGVGVAWLVRGLLYRKRQMQSQPSAGSVAVENEAELVTEEQQN
jgi:hypothetical protein